MAYFEPYIDIDGIHVPTYGEILEFLTDQYKAVFGSDVYLGEETPDYQILSIFAKCLDDYSALAVEAYNDRNPDYASGDALDLLVRFAGISRKPSTASTADLKVSGDEGTVIPSGSQAIDQSGNIWTLNSAYTIPVAGYGTVGAKCETLGAIITPAGTIDRIYTPVPGWTSVTNEAAATSGKDTETDAALRARFAASHTLTKSGTYDALHTVLSAVDGVEFVRVLQNDTGDEDDNGLPAHSICAVVEGGEDDDVAKAILNTKAPGVETYGGEGTGAKAITVVDSYGNSNVIKFARPEEVLTEITISLTPFDEYDATRIDPIIKNAIIEDVNSLGIGVGWSVTMGYKDIYSQFDSKDIPFALTNISAVGESSGVVECDFNQRLITNATKITIVTP